MQVIFELAIKNATVGAQLKELRAQLKDINAELAQTSDADVFAKLQQEALETDFLIRELVKTQKALKKEFDQTQLPIGSVAALRLEYQNLVVAINNMSKADRESDVGANAIARASALKKEITAVEESVGNFTGSVGNYTGGILKAFDILGEVGGTIGQSAEIFNVVRQSITLTSLAADKMQESFKGGVNQIQSIIAGSREYLQTLKDLRTVQAESVKEGLANGDSVQDLGKKAGTAAGNLIDAAKSTGILTTAQKVLGAAMKATGIGLIIALVAGLIQAFQKLAPVVDFVEKAFAGLSAAFDILYKRSLAVVGGLQQIAQGNVKEGLLEIKAAATGVGAEMSNAASAAFELQGRFQDLEDTQKAYALEAAKTEAAIKKLNVELGNKAKSDKERLAIADELTKLELKSFKSKEDLLLQEFQLEKERLAIGKNLSEEQLNQIAAGNSKIIKELEDTGALRVDEADKVRALNIELIKSEGDYTEAIERVNNRKAQIQENARKKREAAQEAEAKAIEAQLARILQLEKDILSADASTIINDFDRKITEIEAKRAEALGKLEAQERQLNANADKKGGLSENDRLELARISEATASFKAAYKLQIDEVEGERLKAQESALEDLRAIQQEINVLVSDNALKLAQADSDAINEAAALETARSKSRLSAKKIALQDELIAGQITQKEFNKNVKDAEYEASLEVLTFEKDRVAQQIALAESLRDAKIDSAHVVLEAQISAIDAALEAEIQALRERQTAQGVDLSEEIEAKKLKAIEERAAARLEATDKEMAAENELNQVQLNGIDAVEAADEAVHIKKLSRIEEEKQKRQEMIDYLVTQAQVVASAIFQIQRNNLEAEYSERFAKIDDEYAKKKEKAQGNAVEIAALEKEQAAKKAALEKQAANERKRIAIIEAVIQGALAVVKALPNPFLAGAAAIAAAAQVAVISSQKFARGGVVGLFGGKPHAQGGTKGFFDDGTEIEVEKDELFVVLNKSATAAYRQLSDLNYKHGGAKFATGGVHDFTPQIGIPGAAGSTGQTIVVVEDTLTEEKMMMFARTVAAESRKAIGEGLDDANRNAERNQSLQLERTV